MQKHNPLLAATMFVIIAVIPLFKRELTLAVCTCRERMLNCNERNLQVRNQGVVGFKDHLAVEPAAKLGRVQGQENDLLVSLTSLK
jgi:hypothetical protein